MAGPTHSGDCFGRSWRLPRPFALVTRQKLESLHGPPERVETYALADGGSIEVYFYRMPQPQPASLWRRLSRLRKHEPTTKQLVPWGFRYGRFAGGGQLYKRLTESAGVTLVSIESAPAQSDREAAEAT